MTAVVERWGELPRQRGLYDELAPRVAELAARGFFDREIAAELGLSKHQVAGVRSKHKIPAGQPQGHPPSSRQPPREVVPPEPPRRRVVFVPPPTDAPPNVRWCAMLDAADDTMWRAMRTAVCKVLGVSHGVGDESLLVAVQHDQRTADQLAEAYLEAFAGRLR